MSKKILNLYKNEDLYGAKQAVIDELNSIASEAMDEHKIYIAQTAFVNEAKKGNEEPKGKWKSGDDDEESGSARWRAEQRLKRRDRDEMDEDLWKECLLDVMEEYDLDMDDVNDLDEDQLDELSKKTLGSYVKKNDSDSHFTAASQTQQRVDNALDRDDAKEVNRATADQTKHRKKGFSRLKYASLANKKLAKEDTLDELSKETLKSYDRKAENSWVKADNKARTSKRFGTKDKYNAIAGRRERGGKLVKDKLAREDTLDELSKSTLDRYKSKAKDSKVDAKLAQIHAVIRDKPRVFSLASKAVDKRTKGIKTANKKLAKEDTLDELSRKTLSSYMNKSLDDAESKSRNVVVGATPEQSQKAYAKIDKKIDKRIRGATLAMNKIKNKDAGRSVQKDLFANKK